MRSNISPDEFQSALGLLERMRQLRRQDSGGSLRQLDLALGYSRGHLRRQLKGEIRIPAAELSAICGLLGSSVGELFAAAKQGLMPIDLWLGEQAQLEPWQRKLLRPEEAGRTPDDLSTALGELDERLRLGLPGATERAPFLAALAYFEQEPGDAAEDLCFRTWDLLGASFRAEATYAASAHSFREALHLCPGQPLRRARILRRACYLAADRREFEQALYFAGQAQGIYAANLCLEDLGRTWIDAGIAANKYGLYEKSIKYLHSGLKTLGEDPHYRSAAHQNLGLCHIRLNEVREARENQKHAQALLRGARVGTRFITGIYCLSAEIAFVEDDFLSARIFYEKVQMIAQNSSDPMHKVFLTLRMAKSLLLLSDSEGLSQLVVRASSLVRPLKQHPFACSVLTEFHRLALDQQLSSRALDGLCNKLMRGGRVPR